MPIGFWAISRSDLKELFEFRVSSMRPKWNLSTPEVNERLNNIIRSLPYELDATVEQAIKREINKDAE